MGETDISRRFLMGIGWILLIFLFLTRKWIFTSYFYVFGLFLIPLLSSLLFIPLVTSLSFKTKMLDYPETRKIHKNPTPLLGGVAIYFSFILGILYNFKFSRQLNGLILGASLIFLLGLIDDVVELSAPLKLALQICACLILIHFGIVLYFPRELPMPWGMTLAVLLTILWVVGITNAINFLDGLDGLATGLGIISSFFFLVIASSSGQTYLTLILIVLIGSLIGFLGYNLNPAMIFLGDSGSTFIGFILAGSAVMGNWTTHSHIIALGTPILILAIPIFDIIYITVFRIVKGETRTLSHCLSYTGKDHFHHRLLELGFNQKETVFFLCFLSFTLSINSLVLRSLTKWETLLVFSQVPFILMAITILMKVSARRRAQEKQVSQ